MSYSKQYFDKDIHNLELADIVAFFKTEKEESNKIEFKAYFSDVNENYGEKENAIIKTLCAFLNSEGGIIIWGAPIGEKKEGKKEKIFQGTLSAVEKLIEKDSIIRKITDSISPSPIGILFQPILVDENKFIYIFEVEKSSYSPHQYKDKYYMRIDGQTKTAPHSYIEALFRKISFPRIEGYLKFEKFYEEEGQNSTKEYFLQVNISIWNLSRLQNDYNVSWGLLNDVGVFLGYNSGFNNPNHIYRHGGADLYRNNVKDVIHYGEIVQESHTIKCNITTLRANAGNIKLLLRFGSKNSPMKTSEYNIYVDEVLGSYRVRIIDKKENKFLYEVSDELRISDKEKIEKYLNA